MAELNIRTSSRLVDEGSYEMGFKLARTLK